MKQSYRLAQVAKPGTIEMAERETPLPGAGEVLIERAAEAVARMKSGEAKFKMVLTMTATSHPRP